MSVSSPQSHLDHNSAAGSFSILADAVGRFVDAWAGGEVPDIGEYLPADGGMRRMLLVELIKVDLEYRWNNGLEKRVHEYVAEFPELAGGKVPVELLYEEYHARQHAGAGVDPDEYINEYPDHGETLKRWLGAGEYQSTVITKPAEQNALKSVQAGDTVDDFDLILGLGQGAFAHVYLARQRSMQRLVALKVSADSGSEPQTLAQLDHDAIVRVFDQHVLDDRKLRLLYMQYLPGGTLQSVVKQVQRVIAQNAPREGEAPAEPRNRMGVRPGNGSAGASPSRRLTGQLLLDVVDETIDAKGEVKPAATEQRKMLAQLSWPETVAWIGARLAEGLDYAHGRGVLHRDIKPANVLLSGEGSPKLADFNISFAGGVTGQTPAAYFGGSLAYMSTEQLEACHPGLPRQADELDGRSDLYSLGVMLWELLTGEKAFQDGALDGGWNEVVEKLLERRNAGPPSGDDIHPPSLRRVLKKCLAPNRADRWQSGKELARQFELCLDERARELLDPPADSWQVRCRHCAVPIVLLAILIPNALAATFNAIYNYHQHIKGQSPAVQADFNRMVALVNGIAFPVGSAVVIWLTWRVVRDIRRMHSANPPTPDEAFCDRRDCLRLGGRCSLVCLALWTIAGIAHPLAIQAAHGTMGPAAIVSWFGSLIICGLIAVAYPFFGVTFFGVRSLFPALLRHEPVEERDERELRRLHDRLGHYLVTTGAVPLLSIGGAIFAPSENTAMHMQIIGWLCVGGIVGSIVVYFGFFNRLQADLEALLRLVRR
jgi:eukaryotic-like serine/threonine-protein kinase